jgi:uncharacterized protein (TIGR02246 family)
MTMKKLFPIVATVLVLAISGCAPQVDVEADKAAIRDLSDVQWLNAEQAKDVDSVLSVFADNASLFPPNASIVTGIEAIRARLSEEYSGPRVAISWQTTKVEVSRSGDLAYSHGTHEVTVNDPEGNPVTDKGKWVTVWEKQPDGTWKVVVDIWNTDQPAASE